MAGGGLFMINITAITTEHQLLKNIPIERVEQPDIAWYWVDFYGGGYGNGVIERFFSFSPACH